MLSRGEEERSINMNVLQAVRDRLSISYPKLGTRNPQPLVIRQRNILYALGIIQVAQETITALAQAGLGGYEFRRREERQSSMEVLTEVSSSGLVCNVLQGSACCQPSSRFPTKKLKLKDPQLPPLLN